MSEPLSRGRLLVVDDEVELLRALCESLTDSGFVVRSLSNPFLVRAALREGEFDVLVTDLLMPGADGIQVLREALETDPGLVGVIMTGQGSLQTAIEASQVGALDYVLKPFRLKTVLPVLDRAVEVSRLRTESLSGRNRANGFAPESAPRRWGERGVGNFPG